MFEERGGGLRLLCALGGDPFCGADDWRVALAGYVVLARSCAFLWWRNRWAFRRAMSQGFLLMAFFPLLTLLVSVVDSSFDEVDKTFVKVGVL